jgi:hypothetical protein
MVDALIYFEANLLSLSIKKYIVPSTREYIDLENVSVTYSIWDIKLTYYCAVDKE